MSARRALSSLGSFRPHSSSVNHPLTPLRIYRRGIATTSLGLGQMGKSTLRIEANKISAFPRGSKSNFAKLRADKGFAYFDRTSYLTVLHSVPEEAVLFLRPRRFGKSLTLSMIEHFHGIEHHERYKELFTNLDIDIPVNQNAIVPGEYLILKFNFAGLRHSQDPNAAAEGLSANILWSLQEFYRAYDTYLGASLQDLIVENINYSSAISSFRNVVTHANYKLQAVRRARDPKHPLAKVKGIYLLADDYDAFNNEYMNPRDSERWDISLAESLIEDFWATVKGMTVLPYGIQKCFITGIFPLSLANNTSSFNIAVNLSFKNNFAGLCGLTRADIEDALQTICPSKKSVSTHLEQLTRYAHGYHFCRYSKTEPVFNTDTSLEYLQAVLTGEELDIANPPDSKVSQRFLNICASSPDLKSRALGKIEDSTSRTLLLYLGAFTFDKEEPAHFLTIPNQIVAKQFGVTILCRCKLLGTIQNAIRFLPLCGDIIALLKGYQALIAECDIRESRFAMTEAHHRDSFHIAILQNPGLDPQVDYEVTKPNGTPGLVNLIITSSRYCIITVWKSIPIDFVDLGPAGTLEQKAHCLSTLDVQAVLKLKFSKCKKYKKGTIQSWIKKEVTAQLKSYIKSAEVQELVQDRLLQAYLILIIGSRKILVWEMDIGGKWIDHPVLAE
ncbi:hypothetical protein B9Z19DRAFT_1120395 [Tuber borchii]|uniref:AAA-ATPase-like domain-containing protein n=1 Tax=Tuber borchii TaxID=42251 RepID=A0A2T7A4P1_TUBBO|nr:hypothetical protein B9Z19DRAFT_1120395 [Tuber borchii]